MAVSLWWVFLLLIVVTIFAVGNPAPITLVFWKWPIYKGTLAVAIVGATAVGGLLTVLPARLRQAQLTNRIRELERERQADGVVRNEANAPESGSPQSSPTPSNG